MTGIIAHTVSLHNSYVLLLDSRDCYTCSFTEFLPFASDLYYYSSLKEFHGVGVA